MSSLNKKMTIKNLAAGETYTCEKKNGVYRYNFFLEITIYDIILIYELTPLRAETTISWSKSLDNLPKNNEVCSNEWRRSDDSTSYSSPRPQC